MNKHFPSFIKFTLILILSAVSIITFAQQSEEDEEKEEGEAMINLLLKADSTSAELYFGAGRFHYEQGEYTEAIDFFNKALHYLPLPKNKKSYGVHFEKHAIDSPAIFKMTALTLSKAGQPAKAIAVYRQLQKISSDKSIAPAIGAVLRENKQYIAAIHYYDSLLRYMPTDTGVLNGLAYSYFDKGDYSKSKNAASAAIQKQPDDVEAISLLGKIALKESNKTEACLRFEEALDKLKKLKPNYRQEAYYRQFDAIYQLKTVNCSNK